MKKIFLVLLTLSCSSLFSQESLINDFIKEDKIYPFTIYFNDNTKNNGEISFVKTDLIYRATITNKTRNFSSTFDFYYIREINAISVGDVFYHYEISKDKLILISFDKIDYKYIEIRN